MKICIIIGTRPEALKLIPLVQELLGNHPWATIRVCATGQHTRLLEQPLRLFGIRPACDLKTMRRGQTLPALGGRLLDALGGYFGKERFDMVVVQGDTTTAMIAALAAFYLGIRVAHVEAGLRSGNKYSPWPEELNRKVISSIADINFAPTSGARENLLREGVEDTSIHVVGNTVIDALRLMAGRLLDDTAVAETAAGKLPPGVSARPIVLVTQHRRENLINGGIRNVCRAVARLAERGDHSVILPVHSNPDVAEIIHAELGGRRDIYLTASLEYDVLVLLLMRARLIITDSGGIQEEATAFRVPTVVTRDTTERPEAVAAGIATLAGTKEGTVAEVAQRLLNEKAARLGEFRQFERGPYGDGYAAVRIAEVLRRYGEDAVGFRSRHSR